MREIKQDWRDVFCGFSIALDARKIILGFAAVVASLAVVMVLAALAYWTTMVDTTPGTMWGALTALLTGNPAPAVELVKMAFKEPTTPEVVFSVFTCLVLFALWCVFGGAISRVAAVQFARDEPVSMSEAMTFARGKAVSYVSAILASIIGIAFFYFCNLIGGLVGRIPAVGPVLVGLGFGLAILGGFIAVFLVIGGVFGLPLMIPTISTEGTDAFDAVSRAFSYVISRPWRYIWQQLCALAYGAVVCAFVLVFAMAVARFTMNSAVVVGMGEGPAPGKTDAIAAYVASTIGPVQNAADITPSGARGKSLPSGQQAQQAAEVQMPSGARGFCAGMIKFWLTLIVIGGSVGFCVSYLFSSQTIIYFLMRKAVDGTDMTEVWVEDEEEDFSLPPAPETASSCAACAAPCDSASKEEAPAEESADEEPAEEEAAKPAAKKKTAKKRTRKTTRKKKKTTRKKKTTE